jgi:hypothetical protein
MGAKVVSFEYLPVGASDWNTEAKQATKIVAKKDNIKLEISKSGNKIYYRVEDNTTSCWCVAYSSGMTETGTVPQELHEFDPDDITHVAGSTSEAVSAVKIVPYVLTEP